MEAGSANYAPESCGTPSRPPRARCWAPGDQEHDHQMCEDVNTEQAIEEALSYAPATARAAAREAIDALIREARLSGLTAGAELGDPTVPPTDDGDVPALRPGDIRHALDPGNNPAGIRLRLCSCHDDECGGTCAGSYDPRDRTHGAEYESYAAAAPDPGPACPEHPDFVPDSVRHTAEHFRDLHGVPLLTEEK